MKTSSIARPAAALLAAFAFFACSKGATSSPPAPSPNPSVAAASASSAAARPSAGARPFTAAMVAEGDTIFHARTCKNCHGPDGKGAKNGPNLTSGPFLHIGGGDYNEIVRIVTNGVPADSIKDKSHTIPMRARGGTTPAPLTDDQIKAVSAYVYSLAHP